MRSDPQCQTRVIAFGCDGAAADSGGPGPDGAWSEVECTAGRNRHSALTGDDVVEVLRARARQLSHEQARLLATIVEVGLSQATFMHRNMTWHGVV